MTLLQYVNAYPVVGTTIAISSSKNIRGIAKKERAVQGR